MKVIGYIRVSSDTQDLEKQRHLLLDYAQQHQILIDRFIEAEISSRESQEKRKIELLFEILDLGDVLLLAELSRLGRSMLETLNIINLLTEKGVSLVFIRQPELSTIAPHTRLLLAIYSYFAETEREYISLRTKQGLAAARERGKVLGRPKGSKNKKGRILEPFKTDIGKHLKIGIPVNSILKIINSQLENPVSYSTIKYYIENDPDLKDMQRIRRYDN